MTRSPGRRPLAILGVTASISAAVLTATPAHAAASSAPAASPARVSATATRPLALRFTTTRTSLPAPAGAVFEGVTVTATGGPRGAAARVATTVNGHVAQLRKHFSAVVAEEIASGNYMPGSPVFDAVDGSSSRSRHYLGVRLGELVNLGGAHPAHQTHAYAFELATGREVPVASLFRSPAAADRRIRAALVVAGRRVGLTAADVAPLSVRPGRDGTTGELSCYPTAPGLTCEINQGGVIAYAAGTVQATVPWRNLALR